MCSVYIFNRREVNKLNLQFFNKFKTNETFTYYNKEQISGISSHICDRLEALFGSEVDVGTLINIYIKKNLKFAAKPLPEIPRNHKQIQLQIGSDSVEDKRAKSCAMARREKYSYLRIKTQGDSEAETYEEASKEASQSKVVKYVTESNKIRFFCRFSSSPGQTSLFTLIP